MKSSAAQIALWRDDPVQMVLDLFGVRPDPWQVEFLRAFATDQRVAAKACKGPGKGHSVDDIVETPDGPVRWGDLAPGMRVFGSDGAPTKVIEIYDRGMLPMVRVHFDDGSSVECDREHLWKVRGRTEKRHGTWSVLSVDEIVARGVTLRQGKGEYYQFQIPAAGPAQYPAAVFPLDPYLIGAWIGDGCRGTPRLSCAADSEIPDIVRQLGYEVSRFSAHDNAVTVSNAIGGLRELGLLDCYAYEKRIPEECLRGSVEQRTALLRGLMDADGSIGKKDGTCTFDTTSPGLAEDMVWLVRSLGGKAKHRKTKKAPYYRLPDGTKVYCRDCYRVGLTTPFNPFLVTHKAVRWRLPSQARYLMRTITRIEELGAAEVRCIEVAAEDSCYLAPNFTVTHNTCCLAWVIWNFLLTRPHPKIAVTSITAENLKDNLWTELSKWQQKSALLKDQFVWGQKRIIHRDFHQTWWASARTWPKDADSAQQADTLAGLHADYILFVCDEAGGYPDAVIASAEAALATGKETKLVIVGNPTHNEGPLYRACHQERHLWTVVEITGDPDDPNRSSRISVQWAREQIEKYGADNPWVLVNVYGRFPPSSINSLLGADEVAAAMRRALTEEDFQFAQKRLGVDVARFGDDRTILFPRQGLMAFRPVEMRNARTDEIAARVMLAKQRWGSEVEFVDDTGGYGGGVVDFMLQSGHTPMPVNFSSKAQDSRYLNLRAEMWFRMAEWVKRGGCLPNMPELSRELTAPTFTFQNGRFKLEEKQQIKARLGFSPDCFVAGTLVSTPDGKRQIQDVSVGDSVLTPMGRRRVIATHRTTVDRLTTVKMSSGVALTGKPGHRVFTWGRGWVRMDGLALTNVLESDSLARRAMWGIRRVFCTRGSDFGFKAQVDTINPGGRTQRSDYFIGGFGSRPMAWFRRACASIMSMAIGPTTISGTLNYLAVKSTCGSTCLSDSRTRSIGSAIGKTSASRLGRPGSGIEAQRGSRGTVSMVSGHGPVGSSPGLRASNVGLGSIAGSPPGRITARRLASRRNPIVAIRRLLGRALSAARSLFSTSTASKSVVPVSVRTEDVGAVSVYNLTLESENVYYANGILVENCADALALTFALAEMPSAMQMPAGLMSSLSERGRMLHEYDPFSRKNLLGED